MQPQGNNTHSLQGYLYHPILDKMYLLSVLFWILIRILFPAVTHEAVLEKEKWSVYESIHVTAPFTFT